MCAGVIPVPAPSRAPYAAVRVAAASTTRSCARSWSRASRGTPEDDGVSSWSDVKGIGQRRMLLRSVLPIAAATTAAAGTPSGGGELEWLRWVQVDASPNMLNDSMRLRALMNGAPH